VRNVTIRNILEDAVSGANLAVNVLVDGIDPGTSGAHPDVYQLYSGSDTLRNKIVYNLRAYNVVSQGLFNGGTPIEDIAFVNIVIDKDTSTVMYTQFDGYLSHVLFWHLTLHEQTFLWRDAISARDTYVQNCILQQMSGGNGGAVSGVIFSDNHFTDTSSYGAGVYGTPFTAGDPGFADPAADIYRLQSGSPARGSGSVMACVPADIEGTLFGASPNKGAYAGVAGAVRGPEAGHAVRGRTVAAGGSDTRLYDLRGRAARDACGVRVVASGKDAARRVSVRAE
jgi:hypothetical protein